MFSPDVFISYSREDRDKARSFAQALAQEGLRVWWDDAIHSGQTFDTLIEQELRAAKAVVVLWSPRSVMSRWVRSEASIADRRNTLVPVIIEACDRPIMFELTHTFDLSAWNGDPEQAIWKVFLKDLGRLIDFDQVERPQDGAALAAGAPVQSPAPITHAASAPEADAQSGEEDQYEATQFISRAERDLILGSDRHCLESFDGDQLLMRVIVQPLGLTLGRSAPSDIILADPLISRRHCRLDFAGDGLQVTDLKSTNGTFVDGERVEGTIPLPAGSKLGLGRLSFVYSVRDKAEV